MTTTPQTEAGPDGTQAVALQLSELVLKTGRYDDMAAFHTHVLGHGPFYERTPDPDAPPRPAEPVVFLKAPSSVIGTGERIRFPKAAPDAVDYEGELAVVIGRRATDVSEAEAYAPVPALVSYLSRQTTLEPGDVISTGTPAGVGHKKGLFLRSGTEVRIEIEGIGALVNICA
ncbi:fumarylacetoacetate hydrolase family protein [Streptomyces sp. NPDC005574]|uniref:fumarylacetoacetate hydrolase family protein n=1 Tax=Streptomyces sp. NPDC005574 TaxID=3156891 RepID=UPI0033B2BBD8